MADVTTIRTDIYSYGVVQLSKITVLSKGDKLTIENMYKEKVWGRCRIVRETLEPFHNIQTYKKIRLTGTVIRKPDSRHPVTACTQPNVEHILNNLFNHRIKIQGLLKATDCIRFL